MSVALQKTPAIQVEQLRAEMLQRGLRVRDLARLAGINPRRLTNVLTGSDRTWPIRNKINAALGQPLFTKPRRFGTPTASPAPALTD